MDLEKCFEYHDFLLIYSRNRWKNNNYNQILYYQVWKTTTDKANSIENKQKKRKLHVPFR